MGDIKEQSKKIKAKVSETLKKAETLSQAEIDMVWAKAMKYIQTLPERERGGFYWNSGLECLFLLTTESKRKTAGTSTSPKEK